MEFHARKALGQRIRMLRNAFGWSQEVLAYLSGLNRSYIGAIERAEHNIGVDNIEKIAGALDVAVADLVSTMQSSRVAEILGKGAPGALTDTSLPTPGTAGRSAVTINRNTFIQLLKQCRDNGQESILSYLQYRGVEVIE